MRYQPEWQSEVALRWRMLSNAIRHQDTAVPSKDNLLRLIFGIQDTGHSSLELSEMF